MTILLEDRQFPSLRGMPGSEPRVALAPPCAQAGATTPHFSPPPRTALPPRSRGRLLRKLSLGSARGCPERKRRLPTVSENSGALVTPDAPGGCWWCCSCPCQAQGGGRPCSLSAPEPGWRRATTWWVRTWDGSEEIPAGFFFLGGVQHCGLKGSHSWTPQVGTVACREVGSVSMVTRQATCLQSCVSGRLAVSCEVFLSLTCEARPWRRCPRRLLQPLRHVRAGLGPGPGASAPHSISRVQARFPL